MPGKHQKGDVVVPTFHASGTGRDLYLNPHAGQDKDELKAALQKPLQYTNIETGEVWVMCCLLVLDSVTSTPQWIRQTRPRVYLKEGTYHKRLFRGPSTNDMKN